MLKTEIPEIQPQQLKTRLDSGTGLVVLDVREAWEVVLVHRKYPSALADPQAVYVPLSDLSKRGMEALPESLRNPETEVVVVCHHGVRSEVLFRSAQVAGWLIQKGRNNVSSLEGGLDAYARLVDPGIGRY
jgi:rhodanese-related sulfurtransferase